jgi:hypothetical protein
MSIMDMHRSKRRASRQLLRVRAESRASTQVRVPRSDVEQNETPSTDLREHSVDLLSVAACTCNISAELITRRSGTPHDAQDRRSTHPGSPARAPGPRRRRSPRGRGPGGGSYEQIGSARARPVGRRACRGPPTGGRVAHSCTSTCTARGEERERDSSGGQHVQAWA